jgi:ribose 5-phosphate isomerase B
MSASPPPEGRTAPSEEEIRALVAAVLEQVASGGPPPGGPSASGPEGTATSSPADGSAGDVTTWEIAIGADHGGFRLKERIVADLQQRAVEVHDCGTHGTESVDYPDFAHAVARLVAEGACRSGIIVNGAGIGSCMVANKVPGVRAATCWDVSSARNSREHNHANVLVLGAGLIGENLALEIVQTWLSTPWGGERHARRVAKIAEIERRYLALAESGAVP